jgi:hypothetical protein
MLSIQAVKLAEIDRLKTFVTRYNHALSSLPVSVIKKQVVKNLLDF